MLYADVAALCKERNSARPAGEKQDRYGDEEEPSGRITNAEPDNNPYDDGVVDAIMR